MISIVSTILAGAAVVLLCCGGYAWLRNSRSWPNRMIACLCLLLGWGCIGQMFGFSVRSADAAFLWYHLSWIGWSLYPPTTIVVALFLLRDDKRLHWPSWVLPLLWIPAVVFLYLSVLSPIGISGFKATETGTFIPVYRYDFTDWAYVVYQYGYDVIALALIGWWGYRANRRQRKVQAAIILLFSLLALVLDSLHYVVGAKLDLSPLWAIEQALFAVGLTYAIAHLKFIIPSVALAADYVNEHIHDMVVLTSLDGVIMEVNAAVFRLLGWTKIELLGRSFREIVASDCDGDRQQPLTVALRCDDEPCEAMLLAADGTRLPVLLSSALLRDNYREVIGVVFVAADLRQMKQLECEVAERRQAEEHLRRLHDELEFQVKQRTAELTATNADLQAEIVERERVEEALRESEEHYRGIFETIQDVYFRLDADDIILQASPSAQAVMGYTPDESIGIDVKNMLVDQTTIEKFEHLLEDYNAISDYEVDLRRKDGRIITVAISCHRLYDLQGEPTGVEGTLRDISQRKTIERALRESEASFRSIFTQSPIAILLLDVDGRPLDYNDALLQIIGASDASALRATSFFDDPDILPAVRAQMRAGKPARFTMMHDFQGSAEYHHVETTRQGLMVLDMLATPLYTAQGEPNGFLLQGQDVTERYTAERALRDSEARFRRIVDDFPGMIWITPADADGVPSFISRQVEQIYYYPAEEFLSGRLRFEQIEFPEDIQRAAMIRQHSLIDRNPYSVELRIKRPDGSVGWVFERGQPVFDEDDRFAYWQGLVLDITELKVAGERLRDYENRLRALALELTLAQEKERRRLAVDLHDQISQQLVFTNMKLQAVRQAPAARPFAEELNDICSQLEQLIRATSTLTFELCPPVLYELGFDAATEWLAEQVQQQHNLVVTVDRIGQYPPLSNDLRVVLFRVLQELLTNVVKHANAGHVGVTVLGSPEEIRIEVVDDGKGMEPSQVNDDHVGGFGFFSIREQLEYYNGRMEVDSAPGSGTCISLIVPLQAPVVAEGSR